jgi:protein-L-isoaspartate(D-aspartate) O-methyltransferase
MGKECSGGSRPVDDEHFASERERMVARQIARRGITDERVLSAMRKVPRHYFTPPEYRHMAYDDGPLPIGYHQTISQPFIVALMTEILAPQPEDRVLEIGVGSGYQTAILAELVHEVVGIERITELAAEARDRLVTLGYRNVSVHVGDGTLGYARMAPYNAILVAAAAPKIPEPLIMQLAEHGRLVIPVGSGYEQVLQCVHREPETLVIETHTPVRFVPLIGQHGFKANT